MILIWKAPAKLIGACSAGAGMGLALLIGELGWMDEKHFSGTVYLVGGATALVADLLWRRSKQVHIFDVNVSTFFWLLPTWTVGLLSLAFGVAISVTE